jgi:hypothetical protein
MALLEADLTSKHLLLAFDRLSVHVKTAFPEVLPLEVFTVGGAMIVILLGSRPTTHDVDVSGKLLDARYAKNYPNIKSRFKELCGQTFTELRDENVDLGSDQWLNYAADTFLPAGLCTKGLELMIGPQMMEKAMEDDIVLFQNEAFIVRSVSFAQTIFQKLKRFQANDSSDVKAIASYLLEKGSLDRFTPMAVLDYLKENVGDDRREVQTKEKLFTQRLAAALG